MSAFACVAGDLPLARVSFGAHCHRSGAEGHGGDVEESVGGRDSEKKNNRNKNAKKANKQKTSFLLSSSFSSCTISACTHFILLTALFPVLCSSFFSFTSPLTSSSPFLPQNCCCPFLALLFFASSSSFHHSFSFVHFFFLYFLLQLFHFVRCLTPSVCTSSSSSPASPSSPYFCT